MRFGIGTIGGHDDAGSAALGAAHRENNRLVARVARPLEAIRRLDLEPIRWVNVLTAEAAEAVVIEEELASVAGRFE